MAIQSFYKNTIPIIDTEGAPTDFSHPKNVGYGYVERDYNVYPESMFSPPSEMEIVPESDWDALYDQREEQQSSLEHIYLSGSNGTPAFVNLNQDQLNYCWIYSTAQSMMIDRLKRNLPMVRFNPAGPGAIIKNGANEGGWCGLSAKFARENGMAIEGDGPGQWPGHSLNLKYNTPLLREQMAKYKIEEEWTDLTSAVYDQNLTRAQVATCGFNNIVGPRDYDWWRHSVCGLRWVRVERGSWGQLILNSWLNWGRFGLAVLVGNKAICNGGLAIRLTSS